MNTCANCNHQGNDVHGRFFPVTSEAMLCDDQATCIGRALEKPHCRFEAPRYCDICVPQMKSNCPNKEGNAINLMPTV